jgi:hypothetical protein
VKVFSAASVDCALRARMMLLTTAACNSAALSTQGAMLTMTHASNIGVVAPPIGRAFALHMMQSDSRPTQEYFDYLLGRNKQETTEDGPSIIVGGGRIGSMLLDFGQRRKYDDILIKRGDAIPANHPGPVYVCTQACDIEAVIAACPEEKKDDLVFMQDGMLEPIFQRTGLYGPTQAALYLACMRKGGKPVDGTNSESPEGLTTVSGKWAGALAMRLGTGNLNCIEKMERDGRRACARHDQPLHPRCAHAVTDATSLVVAAKPQPTLRPCPYTVPVPCACRCLEKLVFVCAYNLVGAVHGGISVGEVAKRHSDEVAAICRELASFIRYTLSVSLFSGVDERLEAYATKLEFMPTSINVDEFEYRNGYFYKYAKMAGPRVNAAGIKVDVPDTTPYHTEYLLWALEKGLISQSLLDSV